MALSAKVVTFLAVDGIVGTTQAITGVGFLPKAILFWYGGSNSAADQTTAGQDARCGFGYAASPTDRGCLAGFNADALATMDTNRATRGDCCIASCSTTAVTGRWDLQSFDADGFTLVVDQDPPAGDNRRIIALCLGGDDITAVKGGSFTKIAGTGSQGVTGVGFQPDMTFLFSAGNVAIPDTDVDLSFSFGFARSAAEQAVLHGYSQDAQANSVTSRYSRFDECLFVKSPSDNNHRATFVSQDADGFTLNWLTGAEQIVNLYLCIKGGGWKIGSSATATSLTTVATSGYGFAPKGVMVLSHLNTAQSTAGTPDNNLNWSVGAADSPTSRAAHSQNQDNGQATSDTWFGQELDEVYSNISGGAGVVGLMDLQSFDVDGATFVMDDADPTARVFGYIAFGDAPQVGGWQQNLSLLGVGA
jgi:hypothetical protein